MQTLIVDRTEGSFRPVESTVESAETRNSALARRWLAGQPTGTIQGRRFHMPRLKSMALALIAAIRGARR
jgi:hypothetical protein